jgi:predicted flap endonuclease-1-like 5' DNA nuclease
MSEAPAEPDDLKMIRGIGPGLESKLNALGVYTFDQIASFSTDDLVWIDENLTAFKGRCFRDDWVGQARSLTG